jgi:hypothetical protein
MPPFEDSESDKEKELEKLHAPAESTDINKKVVTYSGWKSLIWRWKDHIPYAILTVSLVEVQLDRLLHRLQQQPPKAVTLRAQQTSRDLALRYLHVAARRLDSPCP